jgi:type IV secretion system protein VirB6
MNSMLGPGIFTNLYNGYNATLVQGSTAAANALLTAIQPELVSALGLFVIVNGVLVMLARLQWNAAILNCVRAMAVANLLTVAMYNQWVETMFLTAAPNWIAGTTGGIAGGTVPAQFDALLSAVNHMGAVLMAANSGWTPTAMSNRTSIYMAGQFSELALWISFLIDFIAECLMAVVAPIGAVVLLGYMFSYTRQWAERWIGKLVSLLLLELLVATEMKIVLTQFAAFVSKAEVVSGSGIDSDEMIGGLWNLGWAFLFGAAIMICLPAIAAAIGGSHVPNVVTSHINMGQQAMGRMISAAIRAAGRRPRSNKR